ncbi:MAG: hypothetical protein B6241_10470 [Spirochaetaceae bacterium 4572_59]|nr:MAG: hypothetical protein B6241_10470 [Spirochaetaceae bacterium 4572_59]
MNKPVVFGGTPAVKSENWDIFKWPIITEVDEKAVRFPLPKTKADEKRVITNIIAVNFFMKLSLLINLYKIILQENRLVNSILTWRVR